MQTAEWVPGPRVGRATPATPSAPPDAGLDAQRCDLGLSPSESPPWQPEARSAASRPCMLSTGRQGRRVSAHTSNPLHSTTPALPDPGFSTDSLGTHRESCAVALAPRGGLGAAHCTGKPCPLALSPRAWFCLELLQAGQAGRGAWGR